MLRTSGSVDLSTATLLSEHSATESEYNLVTPSAVIHTDIGTQYKDLIEGVDLLSADLTSGVAYGVGSGDWLIIANDRVAVLDDPSHSVLPNGVIDVVNYAPVTEIRWSGQSFSSLGLNYHVGNVDHDLWGATASATDDEKIQFRVSGDYVVAQNPSAVPEPSSTALLGLGSLALLLRRHR